MANYLAPKPTTYRGIHFRSRLEASWALYFDALGWSWIYEPKPLIDDYQPDFRLEIRPGGTVYDVETKPERYPSWTQLHLADAERWDDHLRASGIPLLLLIGRPGVWNEGQLDQPVLNVQTLIYSIDADTGAMEARAVWITGCETCGEVGFPALGQVLFCACLRARFRTMPRKMAEAAFAVRGTDWSAP